MDWHPTGLSSAQRDEATSPNSELCRGTKHDRPIRSFIEVFLVSRNGIRIQDLNLHSKQRRWLTHAIDLSLEGLRALADCWDFIGR